MKNTKRSDKSTRIDVKKEMAKPRVTRSARIAQLNLDTDRIPESPSTKMAHQGDDTDDQGQRPH
jgi:hypothetical protein